MRTKEFKVINNRLLFKCPNCGKKRSYTILNLRRKTLRCVGCGEQTRCVFDRRPEMRQSQSGQLKVTTREGKAFDVTIRDLSSAGIGFEVRKGKDARYMKVGSAVTLACHWNPAMIPKAQYVVRYVSGFRIGVKKTK